MFYWTDVFDIINTFLDSKDSDIADTLECNRSTVSRYRYGGVPTSLLRKFIEIIFVTGYQNSPVSKRNNGDPLGLLKYIISEDFQHVCNDMNDCWDETDYNRFVLKLLSRAKKRSPPKKEKASPKEMPSDQMREIFAEAVAKYNVASCICSLSYFLESGPNYDLHIDCFIEVIQDDLLSKFINYQNECVYKEISQFIIALESYMDSISLFDPTISAFYGNMLKPGECSATLDRVDKDYNELKSSSIDGKPVDNTPNNLSSLNLGFKLGQLDCIRSALRAYNRLDELYSKIFPGMTLLVF